MNVDFTDPQTQANPYPAYAYLQQNHPVYHTKWSFVGEGVLLTRYQDVDFVLRDPRFINDDRNLSDGKGSFDSWWTPQVWKLFRDSMALQDDPEHRRLRTLVHQAFTPKRIQQIQKRVEEIATALLDKAESKGEIELIADYALPLPITIISEMLGISEKDRNNFRKWTEGIIDPMANFVTTGRMFINSQRIISLFKKLINQRRQDPQDDLVTALVQAEQDGDRLNEQELLAMVFLLLFAGHETTINLIGNGILALLQHPDQLQRLQDDPSLIDTAVEEILRFTSPTQHIATRYPIEDVEIAGEHIPRGKAIICMIGAANRDKTVFENGDKLDVGRHPNKHLGFGVGTHYCLGAPLARLEGQIGLQTLIQRFPNLRLAVPLEQLTWRGSIALRGLKSLPLHL